MKNFVQNFFRDDTGAAAAEYALILAIVGAGIAGGALFLGQTIDGEMREAATAIEGAIP